MKSWTPLYLKNETAFEFPPHCIWRICCHVQLWSSCVERTKVRWTPSERWMPEQSMQMKMPYVTEAHVGFLHPQSKHICQIRDRYRFD